MMVSRSCSFALVWLLGLGVSGGIAQSPERPEPATEPEQAASAPAPPPVSERTVEQAVHAAMEILDRLESAERDETTEAAFGEVTDHIDFVRSNDPSNPILSYLYGRAYALVGRQGEAVDQLQQFVETREGRREWRAFRLLGDLFVEQYPQLANAHYQSAAVLSADEPDVLFGLARCAAKLGRNSEAVRLAHEALAANGRAPDPADPQHAAAAARRDARIRYLSFLAKRLSLSKRWDEARREVMAAVDLAEEEMRCRPGVRRPVEVADTQRRLLVDILRARITESDASVDDYLELAEYVRRRNETAAMLALHDALAVLELAVEKTAPNTPPRLMEQHGIVLAEIGRREQAIAVFEKLLAVDPDNAVAPPWLERLRNESAKAETP